jgi:catechol 2,3-dioxygenase-like lactoylglutathione lyase family enzyme
MNRRLYLVTEPAAYKKRLAAILADVQARFASFGIHGLRHYLAIFEAPAYPAPARFELHEVAIMGEIDASGNFRTVLGALDAGGVTLRPQQVDTAGARLVAYSDDRPVPRELTAPREGDRFLTGPIEGDPLYVVAIVDGTPWLVATRKAWRWE